MDYAEAHYALLNKCEFLEEETKRWDLLVLLSHNCLGHLVLANTFKDVKLNKVVECLRWFLVVHIFW